MEEELSVEKAHVVDVLMLLVMALNYGLFLWMEMGYLVTLKRGSRDPRAAQLRPNRHYDGFVILTR